MAKDPLNSIQRAMLARKIAQNNERIEKLERLLQGMPLATVRFADASITDAKIVELSASQILGGTIAVGQEIIINDGTTDRILISHNEIRISKPGVDVMQTITDANKKDFVLISSVDAHKIVYADYVTSGTYNHSVGRVPFFLCWKVDSTTSPTYFEANNDAKASNTQITGIPNPSYLMVFNEGGY